MKERRRKRREGGARSGPFLWHCENPAPGAGFSMYNERTARLSGAPSAWIQDHFFKSLSAM